MEIGMKDSYLISKLNWFYSLEVTQVDNYMTQSKAIEHPYISLALARFAAIEQEHVENIAAYIKNMGEEPTASGDTVSSYLGKIVGKITPSTGLMNMLRINVAVEKKAKSDYKKLIDQVKEPKLLKLLWRNFVDEDLHTSWMEEQIRFMLLANEMKKLGLTKS